MADVVDVFKANAAIHLILYCSAHCITGKVHQRVNQLDYDDYDDDHDYDDCDDDYDDEINDDDFNPMPMPVPMKTMRRRIARRSHCHRRSC